MYVLGLFKVGRSGFSNCVFWDRECLTLITNNQRKADWHVSLSKLISDYFLILYME